MNTKTKYMIPAFVAVFALMFVITTPYVLAEADNAKWTGEKTQKKGHHAIIVEGFTGTIPIPKEMTKETYTELKDQVTVSLGQAVSVAESNGIADAMKASIGVAENGEGNKYLVWAIVSMNKDIESDTMTKNIFVVDAGDATNFITVTKTFDHSKMKEKMSADRTAKLEKFQQKFSEHTGDADVDAARAHFLNLMQQLQNAIKNGDSEIAQSIKKQLEEIRPAFLNPRNSGF